MKKPPILLIAVAVVMVGIAVVFFAISKKTNNTGLNVGSNECGHFSNKDGYSGCMSLENGKEKRCKFKIDNKINQTTQQMEFSYTCSPK